MSTDPTEPTETEAAEAAQVQAVFDASPEVRPRGITGLESPADLLATAFPAFVGRQVREAATAVLGARIGYL